MAALPVATLRGVTHWYGDVLALDAVTLDIPAGCMAGLIGPDGAGKSTLLALVAGATQGQGGTLEVLGGNIARRLHRSAVCPQIAYLPQGLGKNLYQDLSVHENVSFFGRVFGLGHEERERRIRELLESTELADFADRPAKQLSGGMRQKLGLCCALIHDPDLLILDEPTTGVDPLSRRQFWDLIRRMRARHVGAPMSVIVATAYMEEAERFDWLVALDSGTALATGTPAELKARTETTTLEDAFIALLPAWRRRGHTTLTIPARAPSAGAPAVEARSLTRRFRDFTAVDRASFTIERGEIFAFVGANGSGKTTTMRMLTGLLPPTEGEALLFGQPVGLGGMEARRRVGYMSQSFSLYTELTVAQNLSLHARLFHIPRARARERIDRLLEDFGLRPYVDHPAGQLPLGIRQRLSLAVAVVHEPELLVLDEPTSGVDPIARDEFWKLLIALSRARGVTIFVSTHFMNEAARCDRVSLMANGRVLATDRPQTLAERRGVYTLEDAFISVLEEAAGRAVTDHGAAPNPPLESEPQVKPARRPIFASRVFSFGRLLACTIRETLELVRDPIRMGFALFGTVLLMTIFGAGISTDVNNLSFAVLDYDRSLESDLYVEGLRGSPYFAERPPLVSELDLQRRLTTGDVAAAIEIPPGFGRSLRKGVPTEIGAVVDGAMPFRAQMIGGYLQAAHEQFLTRFASQTPGAPAVVAAADIEPRFRYNQDFDSVYAMVPGSMAMLLALFPAILMALAVVREKELGSITNLYVTPLSRLEFLIGKQIPYIGISLVNFFLMLALSSWAFHVPLKGSFPTLFLGTVLYVTATTGYGMLISSFTGSQVAALFGTMILTVLPATQFAGLMTPVSSLSGAAYMMGRGFPMTYYRLVSVGTFTKGLGFADLRTQVAALAVFLPIYTALTFTLLRGQAR
ncbi:MAG TPA: ribosome-associated ATPase/putative transporter RbbA [Gemmatimonadales bacterium]|nr:ribosome-associated ATPase/putative transporter RbbA [Gemmatimonadales bacterium]